MLNNKGQTGFVLGFWIFTAVLCGVTLGVPSIKREFREKKAVTLCQEGYRGMVVPDCQSAVNNMSADEILAYIKDDIEVPQYKMRESLGG